MPPPRKLCGRPIVVLYEMMFAFCIVQVLCVSCFHFAIPTSLPHATFWAFFWLRQPWHCGNSAPAQISIFQSTVLERNGQKHQKVASVLNCWKIARSQSHIGSMYDHVLPTCTVKKSTHSCRYQYTRIPPWDPMGRWVSDPPLPHGL